MKTVRVTLFLILSLTSSMSYAAGWTTWHKINAMYLHSGAGLLYISFKAPSGNLNPDGCAQPSNIVIHKDNVFFKEMYQMALTAKATEKNFRVYLSGCQGIHPKIVHTQMY